jgi:hypothetical protein
MTASKHFKVLSVRIPEADFRRFKSIAARRGVNMQMAVHQALEAWASQAPGATAAPLLSFEGSLADVDIFGLLAREQEAERRKDRDRPE